MAIVQSKYRNRILRRKTPHTPRKRVSKTGVLNVSAGVRLARQRRKDISTSVTQLTSLMDGLIRSKASTLSVKESALRSQLYRSTNRTNKKCRAIGDKVKINDLVTDEVRDRYRNLTDDERHQILTDHRDYRDSNTMGSYITDKSDQHAAIGKLQAIDKLLESLQEQHGIHFVFVAVRGTPNSYVKSHITVTPDAERFWTLSGAEDMHAWSARLEGFCVGGIHELLAKDEQSGLDVRGRIRVLLGKKLVQITGDPKAVMSYAGYERDIVDKYGVVLEGWPFPVLRNLADQRASNPELALLHQRLVNNECFFRKLTEAEIEARAACPDTPETGSTGKKRAVRSDKGTKRGPQRATIARRAAEAGLSHTDTSSVPNTQASSVLPSVPA